MSGKCSMTPGKHISELQALMYSSRLDRDRYLREQLKLKKDLKIELDSLISPIREQQIREALKMLDDNIQRIRFAGFI